MAARAAATISPIGMQRDRHSLLSPAFTLVELLLVMAILLVLMGIVAPSLSRSMRGRKISDESARFLALTEFARAAAVSEGSPMSVWINGTTQHFGLDPKNDYYASKTHRDYALNPDVKFDPASVPAGGPGTPAILFLPNGTPDVSSAATIRFTDNFGAAVVIARRADGWGYEIQKNTR